MITETTTAHHLREGIGLQAYAQVDPLVAYKREAFNMYSSLMEDIRSDIVKSVYTVQVQRQQAAPVAVATPIARNIRTNRDGAANGLHQVWRRSRRRGWWPWPSAARTWSSLRRSARTPSPRPR